MRTFTKALLILILFCGSFSKVKAQYVTLPDTNFVNYLKNVGFSSCITGNQLDTTCNLVVSATTMWSSTGSGIFDLEGLQYFDNLQIFEIEGNLIDTVRQLPPRLKNFRCISNQTKHITSLPDSLEILYLTENQLNILPDLPNSLKRLICSSNQLTFLPSLPLGLKSLGFSWNPLSTFPVLPNGLRELSCDATGLSILPSLPDSLRELYCGYNQLSSIPTLPDSLEVLSCNDNNITILPTLPSKIYRLNCGNNFLVHLPQLPPSIFDLTCELNSLVDLPQLPDTMIQLLVNDNPSLTCLPPIRVVNYDGSGGFSIGSTGIQCLPNQIITQSSLPPLPICDIINQNNCAAAWNLKGKIYHDSNFNCNHDTFEQDLKNVKVYLYKNGLLCEQIISNSLEYSFNVDTGSYYWMIDTVSTSFVVGCPAGNSGFNATIGSSALTFSGADFGLNCKPGFDLGVLSAGVITDVARPGSDFILSVNAGNIPNNFGLSCGSGVTGTVKVRVSGPVTFLSPVNGALIPSMSGDTMVYTISNFDSVDIYTYFQTVFNIDTLATLGSSICAEVWVSTLLGDYNSSNNFYMNCVQVVNSYDPNDKQVYPSGSTDTSQYWLTYTIRFQNTGNAPAQHVYIIDSLDQHIDESSIQLLAYSHEPLVQVIGNVVKFNFPNINLPDSVNNEPDSHGYVQYKVRRNNNLPIGTQIHNTAYIYFDFNPPIQTNTTTNTIAVTGTVSLQESLSAMEMTLYPNPLTSGEILYFNLKNVSTTQGNISLFEMGGRKVFSQAINASTKTQQFTLPILAPGIYLAVFDNGTARFQRKLVVVK